MLKNVNTDREIITTTQAAERANLTAAYITYLLRNRRLEGFQLAREWLVYTDSLESFLATPRKSGPHGPRKKSKPTTPHTTSTTTPQETAN